MKIFMSETSTDEVLLHEAPSEASATTQRMLFVECNQRILHIVTWLGTSIATICKTDPF